MARRRSSAIGDMLEATTRSQLGALVFGAFGIVLVSPVPRMILDAITPSQMTDNPYAGIFGNAYVATGYVLLPWVRVFGFVLAGLAAGSLLILGRGSYYRTHLRSHVANNIAAGILASGFLIAAIASPPRLMPDAKDNAAFSAKLAGRAPPPPVVPVQGADFPENGTVQWGEQGQPIGGNLGRLDVWDVTGSAENKVVRIRSGLIMEMPGVRGPAYATIYVRSGQKVTVTLPNNVPYKVTAIAGRDWKGPEALFGPEATTVDFGQVMMTPGNPQVVAMGASDQPANVVPNDKF